jgi:hypothetical protein
LELNAHLVVKRLEIFNVLYEARNASELQGKTNNVLPFVAA